MRTKLPALILALVVAVAVLAAPGAASGAPGGPPRADAAKKLTKKQKAAKRRAAKRRAAKRRRARRRAGQPPVQQPPVRQPPAITPEAEVAQLLTGKRLHVYIGINIHDSASIDKVFHFCPGGRFVYEYKATTSTDYDMRTTHGSWGVEQAAFGPNREWAGARVRTAGDGESYLLEIVSTARGVRVDGNVAEVTNSSLC